MKWFSRGEWLDDFLVGFTSYLLTSLPVWLGVLFGVSFLEPTISGSDPVSACFHFDAMHYLQIVQEGYSYDPSEKSTVAFFPAYPLLSRWVSQATGLPPQDAALLTAHAALLGAFVLLVRYVRLRWPDATAGQRGVVLVIFGLWPLGLFFRMPYAEGLFLCVTLAVLYGMARGWSLAMLAAFAGLGTAVRPVGVALTAAVLWHLLSQSGIRPWAKIRRVLVLTPLACWGLLAYMGYQWWAFGSPLAFAQTQEHWTMLAPNYRNWSAKLWSLMTFEPIWGIYLPASPRYWGRVEDPGGPLLSLTAWNPILFVLAIALLVLGRWKQWLTGSELVCGTCLLAIPYLTRGYEMSMASHGRFAAVVVVNYLVIGRILAHVPPIVVTAVCTALALGLCLLTSLYVANYLVF